MKKKKKGMATLTWLLVVSGLAMACVGLGLKAKTQTFQGKLAISVPFLLLHDDTVLHLSDPETFPGFTQPESQDTAETQPEETLPSETQPEETPTQPPETQPAVYGQDESYFDDALFIGDSRMVGMAMYARLGQADYFAAEGMSVFKAFSTQASDENFGPMNLQELLASRQYGKIYIMLGLNESGYPLDSLISAYQQMIQAIQGQQPQATIYILKIFGVSQEKANATSYLSPENLDRVNAALDGLADGRTVFCLDPRPEFQDASGYLPEEYSDDGVHLYGKYMNLLAQWLCQQPARP